MSNTVIKVDNLSKRYIIGHQSQDRYQTLRDQIANGAKRFGKRLLHPLKASSGQPLLGVDESEEFWALKDVSFEVKQGDRVGIIGRNGAGKSTLLKILSQITEPTEGRVQIKGRVSSLLEVGTGFHPELTGRENIFLNGAVLGMSRHDIKIKFDEIVAFAEVEKFLDTPVKRYSSGMYVRLAFAVAAHLEPEILIIDEVLAVGDAQFQKKCLGKMEDVSKEGRTVLFVSHNMTAISGLCQKVFLLRNGTIDFVGKVDKGINKYLQHSNDSTKLDLEDLSIHRGPLSFSRLTNLEVLNHKNQPASEFRIGEVLKLNIEFDLHKDIANVELGFIIQDLLGKSYSFFIADWEGLETQFNKGHHNIFCEIPYLPYLPGTYGITPWIKRKGERIDDQVNFATQITVVGYDITGFNPDLERYSATGVYVKSNWTVV